MRFQGFNSVDAFLVAIIFCLMFGIIYSGYAGAVAKNNFSLPPGTIVWQNKLPRDLGEVRIIILPQRWRNRGVDVQVSTKSSSGVLGVVDWEGENAYLFDRQRDAVVGIGISLPSELPFKGKDGKIRSYPLSYRRY